MPRLGAHMSIAGGCFRAAQEAQRHGCEALQLFTKNSNQWSAKPLLEGEVAEFKAARDAACLTPCLAHDSYLINLASPDPDLYRKSIEAFVVELERAEKLGLDYLVTHPGAHVGSGEEAGLARVAEAIDEAHARTRGFHVRVLLETTAGQGSTLGYLFEHLGTLLRQVREADRLGVCFDTCHVFAAGYALAPRRAYLATMRELDEKVGLDRVLAFHLNDSLKPLGSRVDRHAHIGKGHLGEEPFACLLRDRRFRDRPMILETPKNDAEGNEMDPVNLALLRGLAR